jgi:hypothetical protein
MLNNLSKLELKIIDKTYQFLCDIDSPLEHVKEALFQMQKYVGIVEDQVKAAQQKEQTPPSTPVENATQSNTEFVSGGPAKTV